MDPNSAPQLDSKLKETYNKIMGFSPDTTPPTATTTPTSPTTNDQTNNVDANLNSAPLTIPITPSTTQTPPPVLPEDQTPAQPLNAIPNNILEIKPEANNTSVPPVEKKESKPEKSEKLKEDKNNPEVHGFIAHNNNGKKISPIIIVLAAVVILIAYALFWIKLLNLHIPALGI